MFKNFKAFSSVFSAKIQTFLPQHWLSRTIGKLAQSSYPPLKNILISLAIKKFKINLSDALIDNPKDYLTFNDFFTRKLKSNARTWPKNSKSIASPADGNISQIGQIKDGKIFQAKNHFFTTLELLGGDSSQAELYKNGHFATIYLSPKDYHRVHMPLDGNLISYTHIPGRLFSVNPNTTEQVPNLFARNERVCFFFESPEGPFIIIMVGAMLVASIGTPQDGLLTPPTRKNILTKKFPTPRVYKQGDELGFFQFGSTAIMLFPASRVFKTNFKASDSLLCGQALTN